MPLTYISTFVPYCFDYSCYCSLKKLCSTLCDLMDYSMPDSSVLHCWPRACSNSCPLRHWHYLAISSSANPFSFCIQSFPASRSFPMSQLFTSGGQSTGPSASASVSPSNVYSGLISFRIDWFDLLAVQGTQESSPAPQFKSINFQCSAFFMVQLSHLYMTGKTIALTTLNITE